MAAVGVGAVVLSGRPLGAQEVALVRDAESVAFELLAFDTDDALPADVVAEGVLSAARVTDGVLSAGRVVE